MLSRRLDDGARGSPIKRTITAAQDRRSSPQELALESPAIDSTWACSRKHAIGSDSAMVT
eukprot:2505046-Rhodomonas_salina.1